MNILHVILALCIASATHVQAKRLRGHEVNQTIEGVGLLFDPEGATPVDILSSPLATKPRNILPIYTPPRPGGGGSIQIAGASSISYHNGPVMSGTPKINVVWYGNWNKASGSDTPAGRAIITRFLASLSNSNPYMNILKSYNKYPSSGGITGLFSFSTSGTNEYFHPLTLGTSLSDASIETIVKNAVAAKWNGVYDSNAIYLVLTSSEINASSGFCTQYCGWHSYTTVSNIKVKYAFIGNPQRCMSGCTAQTTKSPNGIPAVDGMISVIAHEIVEAVTDPVYNAWWDQQGYENADKCAWTFGTTYRTSNGAMANMKINGFDYLIQQNFKITATKAASGAAWTGICTVTG